eukprot:EG_transcript_7966
MACVWCLAAPAIAMVAPEGAGFQAVGQLHRNAKAGFVRAMVELWDCSPPEMRVAFMETSEADGKYAFRYKAPGKYMVRVVPPHDKHAGTLESQCKDVIPGETLQFDVTFDEAAAVDGLVFLDHNGNGVRDLTDRGLPGVRVELLTCADGSAVEEAVVTAADPAHPGHYHFGGLSAGSYRLRFAAPNDGAGYQVSSATVNRETHMTECFTLRADGVRDEPDVGFFPARRVDQPEGGCEASFFAAPPLEEMTNSSDAASRCFSGGANGGRPQRGWFVEVPARPPAGHAPVGDLRVYDLWPAAGRCDGQPPQSPPLGVAAVQWVSSTTLVVTYKLHHLPVLDHHVYVGPQDASVATSPKHYQAWTQQRAGHAAVALHRGTSAQGHPTVTVSGLVASPLYAVIYGRTQCLPQIDGRPPAGADAAGLRCLSALLTPSQLPASVPLLTGLAGLSVLAAAFTLHAWWRRPPRSGKPTPRPLGPKAATAASTVANADV